MNLRDTGPSHSIECEEFLARHSDYLDGLLSAAMAARVRGHAEACASCARYDRVVRRGAELARDLLPIEPGDEFEQRLQHRLFHLQDEAALQPRPAAAAGMTLAAAAAIALLAWSPVLMQERAAPRMVLETRAAPEPRAASSVMLPVGREPFAPPVDWQMLPSAMPYAVSLTASFPGPYSPLVVTPPAHRTVRRGTSEYGTVE